MTQSMFLKKYYAFKTNGNGGIGGETAIESANTLEKLYTKINEYLKDKENIGIRSSEIVILETVKIVDVKVAIQTGHRDVEWATHLEGVWDDTDVP